MFHRIGIVTRTHEPAVELALQAVLDVLAPRNCEVMVDDQAPMPAQPGHLTVLPRADLAADCELLISIGGDGTLLQSAGLIYPRETALLGINLGRLGFLTDLQPEDISDGLAAVLDGRFLSEERAVLGCEVTRDGRLVASEDALNDVVVQKWNSARLITLDTYVDHKFLHSQRSDGLIIATPTGSTAYALSCGGPILDPCLGALSIVPICPHTLTNRPIVISDRSHVEIEVATDRDAESRVTCDGNPILELQPGDRVAVYRRQRSIRLIHPAVHDHFSTLRAKLNWGQDPC